MQIHVQDARSTDGTKNVVEHWKTWSTMLGNKNQKIEISFRSEMDAGLYDAIDRASKLMNSDDCIMTWIGADDIFMPGALATVASVFSQRPEIMWLTGSPHVANGAGEVFTPWSNVLYSRYHLYAGRHDGRKQADGNNYGFVQQEGTFWRRHLWNKSGGIDTRFKLAGDWDLWRRFAEYTTLYCFTFPLACFSRRIGQKSSDMAGYYKEVDQIGYRDPPFKEVQAMVLKRYAWDQDWIVEPQFMPSASPEIARAIRRFFRRTFFKKAI